MIQKSVTEIVREINNYSGFEYVWPAGTYHVGEAPDLFVNLMGIDGPLHVSAYGVTLIGDQWGPHPVIKMSDCRNVQLSGISVDYPERAVRTLDDFANTSGDKIIPVDSLETLRIRRGFHQWFPDFVADGPTVCVPRKSNSIIVEDCNSCVFTDVTVDGSPNMSIAENGGGYNRYERLAIRNGNADGFHSADAVGGPVLHSCLIDNCGDDSFNRYQRLSHGLASAGNTLIVAEHFRKKAVSGAQAFLWETNDVGSMDPRRLRFVASAIVEDVTEIRETQHSLPGLIIGEVWTRKLTLSDEIPELQESGTGFVPTYVSYRLPGDARAELESCRFTNNWNRGVVGRHVNPDDCQVNNYGLTRDVGPALRFNEGPII